MSTRQSPQPANPANLQITAADIKNAQWKLDELRASLDEPVLLEELTEAERKAIAQQMTPQRGIVRLEAVISDLEKEKAAKPETRGRKQDSLRLLRQNAIVAADNKRINPIEYFDKNGIKVLPSWMRYAKTWREASAHPKLRSQVPKELSALRRRNPKRKTSA